MEKILVVCTTDSMIWNFLVPHILDLQQKGFTVECACSETGDFFSKLRNEFSFRMYRMNFKRSPYDFRNFGAYRQLKNLIQKEKYDTVFCHEPVGGLMGRLAGKKCGCRVAYMAHGFHFYEGAPALKRFLYYHAEKFLSKYTDVLITINREDYEAAKSFHAREIYKVDGIGVDTSKFVYAPDPRYLRRELGLSERDFLVLSVGELIPRKNHETVMRALLRLDLKNVHYIVAGDGEGREELKHFIEERGLSERVHLLGFRRDIGTLCNSADLFALPSVHEGLSVALMEAMACGKPVVASRIRGNTDLIDEGMGGYLIETFDVKGYAEAIEKLALNEEKRKAFSSYNRNKVKSFDLRVVRGQLQKILTGQ